MADATRIRQALSCITTLADRHNMAREVITESAITEGGFTREEVDRAWAELDREWSQTGSVRAMESH